MKARESPGVGGVVAETLAVFFTRLHWVLLASVPGAMVAGAAARVLFARAATHRDDHGFRRPAGRGYVEGSCEAAAPAG